MVLNTLLLKSMIEPIFRPFFFPTVVSFFIFLGCGEAGKVHERKTQTHFKATNESSKKRTEISSREKSNGESSFRSKKNTEETEFASEPVMISGAFLHSQCKVKFPNKRNDGVSFGCEVVDQKNDSIPKSRFPGMVLSWNFENQKHAEGFKISLGTDAKKIELFGEIDYRAIKEFVNSSLKLTFSKQSTKAIILSKIRSFKIQFRHNEKDSSIYPFETSKRFDLLHSSK